MKSKLIHEAKNERSYLLVFEIGDEVIETLTAFAAEQQIEAARLMAIGGFREATLGYFELDKKQYLPIEIGEQVEVVSLLGNIAMDVSQEVARPRVHAHAVVSKPDGGTQAGHLIKGVVRPTMEMFVTADHAHLEKQHDPATGLSLFRL